ncbi:MAG TPA: PIN domain-containing protein [Terriglobales bacterium]|nr:PIN domain-containing protein [Terriglobales bacterium]
MSSDLDRVLRRLKPERRVSPLKIRDIESLNFLDGSASLPAKLLYDTTVYIDVVQNRFPPGGDVVLLTAHAWHSTVTEAELVAPCRFLKPDHPETPAVLKAILALVQRRPRHRTIAPDREIWLEAGILSGMLARLQNYGRSQRLRLLNDALLLATARKYGLTLLTRNITDFDLLQQLEPSGKVLFYNRS